LRVGEKRNREESAEQNSAWSSLGTRAAPDLSPLHCPLEEVHVVLPMTPAFCQRYWLCGASTPYSVFCFSPLPRSAFADRALGPHRFARPFHFPSPPMCCARETKQYFPGFVSIRILVPFLRGRLFFSLRRAPQAASTRCNTYFFPPCESLH